MKFVSFGRLLRFIRMKIKLSGFFILMGVSYLLLMAGCTSTNMHTQTIPDEKFKAALEASDPVKFELPEVGSEAEAAMLDAVKSMFVNYTHDALAVNVQQVYAADVYFRDAFRQLDRAADIEAYLIEGLEPLADCEFVFNNISRAGGDFYLDWTMRVDFKKTPAGTWEESMGMTRMRFNSEGQVIFHQDYWDPTDIVYVRIPVAKQLISYVKSKL